MTNIHALAYKFRKHNKLIAWFIILSVFFSLGAPVWSDETGDYGYEEEDAADDDVLYDLPRRNQDELWDLMQTVAQTDSLELRILEQYEYIGRNDVYKDFYVYDEDGEMLAFVQGMFDNDDETLHNRVRVYDENGDYVETKLLGDFSRSEDDDGIVRLTYSGIVSEEETKIKQEGMFAVRVKANGYIWWSKPINAVHDPFARVAQKNNLSSPIVFNAGNPNTHSTVNVRSNTVESLRVAGQPQNYYFVNAVESIEEIPGGARFNYNFPDRSTKLSMEVVLEDDSVLVTIPQDRLNESNITGDSGSVMLTLSLLNSFGAASNEEGFIVVPDGSGAVIEFDNNRTNAAQYFGQVYGRDYAVTQRFAPAVNQQVYLPVYGIVRGDNALVAIAEKGDENATIRAAVSRQGANSTSYNLAWFDFNMRTVDSFNIGTELELLTIYESGFIKTGDIAVRYFPIAGQDLCYTDVAHTYRDYLIDNKGVGQRISVDSTPFYLTLNGGTVKRHSIIGFPVSLQTSATTYSQAQEIAGALKSAGIEDLVIVFNDFSTPSIKREIASSVKYSSMLGGKNDYKKLAEAVNGFGYTMYPSLGFMEFHKSGGGYSFLLHSSKEVTRSVARQQRYELAFGTPDPLHRTSTILSPFYYNDVIDSLIDSLIKEGISNISLDRAASLLYSDFSRRNPFGESQFNRRDTVQILTEGFARINNANISIMAQSANAYALPYVSHISNVPLFSSNYDIFDYDVPFYQIVVHGLIPYSTRPFNASSDLSRLTLLALSTGTPVHYEFMYASPGDFNDSDYNSKFFSTYQGWVDEAVEMYRLFKDIIGDTAGQKIVGHTRLSAHETETVFEGGKVIYVNFETDTLRVQSGGQNSTVNLSRGGGV
jgi:hypothetical protein